MNRSFDFTSLSIANADGASVPMPSGPSGFSQCEAVAFFGNLQEHLCGLISDSQFVVGCAAWLTNRNVLRSLITPKWGCQVIVQKEDWLRPDLNSRTVPSWKQAMREMYSAVDCKVDRHVCAQSAGMPLLSYSGCCDEDALRCAGNHNSDKNPAFPRMHHKFFVFCDIELDDCQMPRLVVPRSVWTGSFNPTANGTKSRENAVLLIGDQIAAAFFREWFHVYAISEPLDWGSAWCEPEFRFGS